MNRTEYVIPSEIAGPAAATTICAAILDAIDEDVAVVYIDAYTDYRTTMPPEVIAAERALRDVGASRTKGDSAMDIHIRRSEAEWDLVRVYAPWSINAEFYDDAMQSVATFHDSGSSITCDLTDDQRPWSVSA